MRNVKEDLNYETVDFYLACFLELKIDTYCEIKKKNGKVCTFVFEDNGKIKELVKDYYNDSPINVLQFKDKLRNMKSRLINLG